MTVTSPSDVVDDLRRLPPAVFVENHLFDRIPAIFVADRGLYIEWKRKLGSLIDVDPACLAIVGSAATGISLSPHKSLKVFDASSDVDVAVISAHHFNIAWRYLRMNGGRRLRVDAKTRNAWDQHVNRYIYWGTIATDRLLGVLPFGKEWLAATTAMSLEAPSKGRSVNLRIYTDYDALRSYHVRGVRELQVP